MGFENFISLFNNLDTIRLKGLDEKAGEVAVRRYLELALQQKLLAPLPEMLAIKETMDEDDLRVLARNVFEVWLKNPEPDVQKGVFLLFGLHSDDADVVDLWRMITAWLKKNDEMALTWALDGVLALTLSRSEMAPMLVEHISRNTTDENVRQAALEILAPLTDNLKITWDELQDYTVPTLGYDDNGQRTIFVCDKCFTAVITPFLTLEITDADGVLVAIPPEDDLGKADGLTGEMEQVVKQFYNMKKALDAVVAVQSSRLRLFMLAGRNWDTAMWQRLFVYNPILQKFSATLVWGVYEDLVLTDTFICNINDGTFSGVDGEAFDFASIGAEKRINPVHVLELAPDLLEAWRARIAADGILQPLRQMEVEPKFACATTEDSLVVSIGGYEMRVLKGFDRYDCSEENRYYLESLGRILGKEGKELFLDIYYNGQRCLQERVLYPLTCEAGDPDLDAIVEDTLENPQHRDYPWFILALERNKTPYWLNRLYENLRTSIQNGVPNAFGARGLLHADLFKYYDIARDMFILYWQENLATDMGIYAFEANASQAVKDLLPYIVKLDVADAGKAKDMALQGIIQAAYRHLSPKDFYDAFKPVFDNPATRPEFVEAFMARVKYDWNKRDLCIEMQMDVPVRQLLTLDYRWYDGFFEHGLVDFVVHSVTKDMPAEAMAQIFNQIIDRDFDTCEDLDAFYKYALGMSAMGYKDFLYNVLERVKRYMPKLPYQYDTLRRLAYYMEKEVTAHGDEFWLQQFILLDPAGFAGVFEGMRETADDDSKELIDRILKSIYEIIYRQ